MGNDSNETVLLWVDVETTGLDPQCDQLLEVGMRATGGDLKDLVPPFHTAIRWTGEPDAFIQRMHGPNGLLAECAHPSTPTLREAAVEAGSWMRMLEDGFPDARILPAGSTVRFDRGFLDRWMPGLLGHADHRSLDVSALDEAARMWSPRLWEARPAKTTDHRCMHCLEDSLRLASHYRGMVSCGE